MKKQVNNKYLEKYKTTADLPGSIKRDPNKIPGYHSSGRVEYVRHLPPIRNQQDIDLTILAQVLKEAYPDYNFAELMLNNGLCSIGKVRFRYTDIKSLLKELREVKYIGYEIDSVYDRYNTKYHENKNDR